MKNCKTALVLAPHPDDGEFGCGGTICKLREYGVEVHYAAFSLCEKSITKHFDKDVLYTDSRHLSIRRARRTKKGRKNFASPRYPELYANILI